MFPHVKLKAKLLHSFKKIYFKLSGKFAGWEKGTRREWVTKLTHEKKTRQVDLKSRGWIFKRFLNSSFKTL